MQQYKITKKVEQIEKIAKNEEQIPQSITDVMESFDTKSVLTQLANLSPKVKNSRKKLIL